MLLMIQRPHQAHEKKNDAFKFYLFEY